MGTDYEFYDCPSSSSSFSKMYNVNTFRNHVVSNVKLLQCVSAHVLSRERKPKGDTEFATYVQVCLIPCKKGCHHKEEAALP